ncbi:MAG: aldo/keto reductase [Lentisphaeria bacterium]|jgi:hypothetical protein
MQPRPLGRTGLQVSPLGFGAMRLPMAGEGKDARVNRELAIPMIHRALAGGVTYIDTAVGYCNEDSQRVVGEALKGWRARVTISTKNPYLGEDEKEWWRLLEQSLERLGVASIDLYHHHGVNWESFSTQVLPRVGRWMLKAKAQGLVKHVCVSFHDTNEALKKIVATGYPEVITLQYNLLDRQLEEGIALAQAAGIGVVVMGPVAGGRLGDASQVLGGLVPGIERVPELALRFVLANPHVAVALSGMGTLAQVEANLEVAADPVPLRPADKDAIEAHLERLKAMADLYCTGCNYCLPCPQEVAIPKIFERYNRGRVYGLWESARNAYATLGTQPWDPGRKADACTDCGLCETKCPQRLPIRQQLREAHAALTGKPATP